MAETAKARMEIARAGDGWLVARMVCACGGTQCHTPPIELARLHQSMVDQDEALFQRWVSFCSDCFQKLVVKSTGMKFLSTKRIDLRPERN